MVRAVSSHPPAACAASAPADSHTTNAPEPAMLYTCPYVPLPTYRTLNLLEATTADGSKMTGAAVFSAAVALTAMDDSAAHSSSRRVPIITRQARHDTTRKEFS